MSLPLVTVGMPVLNGGHLFQNAIESILNQTYQNIEILISDNGSTDQTEDVCLRYAETDSRIRLVRQKYTTSALSNFQFVYQHARGKYFMWASHDDWWSPSYIESGVDALEHSPAAVAAMGIVHYLGKDGYEYLRHEPPYGLASVEPTERVREYFKRHITDNLLYALYRRNVFHSAPFTRSTCPEKGLIVHAILQGAIIDVPRMEYFNRVSFKTNEEIVQLLELPSYSLLMQAKIFQVVSRELWSNLSIRGFLSVFPTFVLQEQWHKWMIKAVIKKLFFWR
jgi:glycosyltransferase involved in cell wall biosynthesis